MHNTLAASDYGLIDQNTLEPRPNYWVAWLWHKLMGTTVLDPQASGKSNTYVYDCFEGRPGGVTLLVINADRQHSFGIDLPNASERYTITARQLEETKVELNRKPLLLTTSGDMPQLRGEPVNTGHVSFAPTSITYLSIANAGNANCH